MNKKIFCATALFLLATTAQARGYSNVILGTGPSLIGKNQILTLFNTPEPGITNTYDGNGNNQFAKFFGVGGGYEFPTNSLFKYSLGLQAAYLDYGSVNGTLHPLVNVAPDFDTLYFSYDVQSYMLLVNPSIAFNTACNWTPFFTLGLGISCNRATGYSEEPRVGSTATPSVFAFRNHTQQSFVYAPLLGIDFQINCFQRIQLGYQYTNSGNAELGTKPHQQTHEHLQSGKLNAHLFMINFIFI